MQIELWAPVGPRVQERLWGAQRAQPWSRTGWQGYSDPGSPTAFPRLRSHPKMCREMCLGGCGQEGTAGGADWGPSYRVTLSTGAALPLTCLGAVSPVAAVVVRFWAVRGEPPGRWGSLRTPDPLPRAVPCPLRSPLPGRVSPGRRGGAASLVPLLALELIRAGSLPGRTPAAGRPGGGRLSMETAV